MTQLNDPALAAAIETELAAGCKALQLDLNEQQMARLLHYLALLSKWNSVYNLCIWTHT